MPAAAMFGNFFLFFSDHLSAPVWLMLPSDIILPRMRPSRATLSNASPLSEVILQLVSSIALVRVRGDRGASGTFQADRRYTN